ncbi:hypothetical protein JCM8097_005105 [Rhodosporidiobolus ruineniae]
MLARGAACDTCRARKVKCDASRPYCSPCLKSARGDVSVAQSKCKYEGTSVAAAREAAAQAAAAAAAENGGTAPPKRKRASKKQVQQQPEEEYGAEGDEGDDLHGGKRGRVSDGSELSPPSTSAGGGGGYPGDYPVYPPTASYPHPSAAYPPPPPQQAYGPSPSASVYPPYQHHQPQQLPPQPPQDPGVVNELTNRLAQLERQLAETQQQQQAPPPPPVPQGGYYNGGGGYAPHTRSPSFPFGSAYPPPPGSSSGAPAAGPAGYQLPPLSTSLPPPPGSAGGRPITPSGAFALPPLSASQPPSASYNPSSTAAFAAAIGAGSPRPSTGQRTPLPSFASSGLSSLATAAGVRIDDAPFPASSSSSVSASHPPYAGLPPPYGAGTAAAVPSPVSSLRHLVAAGEEAASEGLGEGERGSDARVARSSPRHSLWGITNGAPGGAGGGRGFAMVVNTATAASAPASSGSAPSVSFSPADAPPVAPSGEEDPTVVSPSYDLPDLSLTPDLYTLLHPSYPPSLPPPQTLAHLVSAFFSRARLPAAMLDRPAILRALRLGPADRDWPEEGLLHAMCATGTFFVAPEALEGDAPLPSGDSLGLNVSSGDEGEEKEKRKRAAYWMRDPMGARSAREYHFQKAKRCVERAVDGMAVSQAGGKGSDLFQILQATILLSYVAYTTCTFSDLWLLSGLTTRLCTPLGLSHLDPWDFETGHCGPAGEDWGVRVRFVERRELMPKVRTLDEHWRRSVTFWAAFAVDRWASASTDWSTSIDEKDISTHLPCMATMPMPGLRIDRRTGQIPSLSIKSPSFLEDTSAPVGSLGLYIKATVLLGRVVNFLQRLPRARCIDVGQSCWDVKEALKQSPEFVELDVALSKFKATQSAKFFDATGTFIDGFLTSAYVVPHVATILLHEAMTDRLDQSPSSSLARCLAAAKCVVNSMFILYQSSYDLGGCDPFIPFTWSVAGRALVRDYATRRRWPSPPVQLQTDPTAPPPSPPVNYVEEAEASRQLAEHCLSFMQQCGAKGSAICLTLAATLQGHLANPDALLPFDGTESWAGSAYAYKDEVVLPQTCYLEPLEPLSV